MSTSKTATKTREQSSELNAPNGSGCAMTPAIARSAEVLDAIPSVIDTEREHSETAESANKVREYLATDAHALVLAIDTAETIKPANSLERMLGDQLAAIHRLAMRFITEADGLLEKIRTWTPSSKIDRGEFHNRTEQLAAVEAARLIAQRLVQKFRESDSRLL